jgi:MoaA/NifB/PqqE/SkfB family radical SAM enzyme
MNQEHSAKLHEFYDWGVRGRLELIPTARKVRRDFALFAEQEPDGPAILRALDNILREAERWHDRSFGLAPAKGPYREALPEVDLPLGEIISWAEVTNGLFETVSRLGTYCHFRLKELRKNEAAQVAPVEPPLFSKEEYRRLKIKNSLLNNLEILLGRTSLSSYPLRLEIDPTNECNLRCRGCRHGITKEFHHTEMRREYVEIISEAFPFVDYMYPIGTGEPTMSSTTPMLIREAARHQVKVDLLTNGIALEKANVPWEAFYRLGISVDGASEETMRALRPVAPLAHVLTSLKKLRANAPQATIYTKVTVSRMNYDELPALMEKLADSGVNEVIVHSLEVFHTVHEAIQVRACDRQHMEQCVQAAKENAERRGMQFVNALNFDGAARHDESARDKGAMLQVLKENPLPVLQIRELPALRKSLESAAFSYYPEALVRAAGLSPNAKAAAAPPTRRPPAVEIQTIDRLIEQHVREAREITPEQAKIPYCFLPWKMPIVAPDGRTRACCHLFGQLGDIDQGRTFQDLWSSPGYVQLRESMFQVEKLPDSCATCREFDRSAYSDETLALADMLAVPIRQAPRYPAPMDVTRLLRTAGNTGRRQFEPHGAKVSWTGRFIIPPGGQIVARFPNPKSAAGVYYQGKFHFEGGRLLVGVKPFWGDDLWHHFIDSWYTNLLGNWVGLPMPPLPLDFSSCSTEECCVFLWAPPDNSGNVEVKIKDFSGVATAPGPCHKDGLQIGHLWLGDQAAT